MAERVRAGLTASQGRKFGLTLGIAFLVFGSLFYWRGHMTVAGVGGVLGAVLVLAALVIPTKLGPIEKAWMGFARVISKVTTPIFMGIVYFLVVAPIGIVMRLFRRNPLTHTISDGGYWVTRSSDDGRGGIRHQY